MIYLRSAVYFVYMVITAVMVSIPASVSYPVPFKRRYHFIKQWARLNIWGLKHICGLDYEIKGRENIPQADAIIVMSKHQSTWETYALQLIFPPFAWILKRELLRIPFFGWGLAATEPVAIDRSSRKKAMVQVIRQGEDRLKKGRWVVVFPEGTRIAAGAKGRYKLGGARLATHSGVPVLPVAHNAGEFWPRHGFLKHPGTITLSIGPLIESKDKTAEELNSEVEAWIEGEMSRITTLK